MLSSHNQYDPLEFIIVARDSLLCTHQSPRVRLCLGNIAQPLKFSSADKQASQLMLKTESSPKPDRNLAQYTATSFPASIQCEQSVGVPSSSAPSMFDSNLPQSYYQPIQQSLQCLALLNHFDRPMASPTYFEGQPSTYGALDQTTRLDSPNILYPGFRGNVSVGSLPPTLEPCRHMLFSSWYPPYMYPSPAHTDLVSRSLYGGTDAGPVLYTANSDRSKSAMDELSGRRHSETGHNEIRTTLLSGSETGLGHHSSCKSIKCLFKAQNKDICGQIFTRVEHLRRHMKTVHSGFRIPCEVPLCNGSFSRLDNLYEHYYSHADVEKPGRNRRLGLEELGQILDSRIFRILKRKMERPRKPTRRSYRRSWSGLST
jgi:hypothetical protein